MCNCCSGGGSTPPTVVYVDLSAIMSRLDTLEELMVSEVERVAAIDAKLDDLIADVRAVLTSVRGELSPEGVAAVDALEAKLDAFDAEIGDGDGSDTPAPPVEPTA